MFPALNEVGEASDSDCSDRQCCISLRVILTQPRMIHARPCTASWPVLQ